MAFSVYMLELQDGSYYVGFSDNLKRRMQEHAQGIACAHTKKIPMKRLLWSENNWIVSLQEFVKKKLKVGEEKKRKSYGIVRACPDLAKREKGLLLGTTYTQT